MTKRKLYVLVGVPGSGKSTWLASQDWTSNCVIASTDSYVEEQAKLEGKTYTEVFKDFMPFAVKLMAADVERARADGKDIVWDQTNTTVATRASKLRQLPNYEAIAVVFAVPDSAELAKRLASRPGKVIPDAVMQSMIDKFEMPTKEEGFTEIWYV